MANMKLVVQSWGVEIHTRKDEKDVYKQVGAAVESENNSGLIALEHYLGRKLAENERTAVLARGFLEV